MIRIMIEMTQEDWLNELEAQIEAHGIGKLVFWFGEEGADDKLLIITDVRFEGENIEVNFTEP